MQLSVVIITLNEEANIARCLTAAKSIADEIVVVDAHSKDRTKEICQEFNVNFIEQEWLGYSQQKNFANSRAKHDWILSLDADEVLSDELIQSIKQAKSQAPNCFYRINRRTNYCGVWIKYCGWYPDQKIRIFDRNQAKWHGAHIHERLLFDTKIEICELKGDLLHYSYPTIETHVTRADRYSTLGARELYARGKRFSYPRFFANPIFKFVRMYFFKLGFLEGSYGLCICVISAYAALLKQAKLRYIEQNMLE